MPSMHHSGFGAALGLAGLLIGAAVAVVLVGGSSGPSSAEPALPLPPSALAPENVPLGPHPVATWAPVVKSQQYSGARPAPSSRRTADENPTGTTNIVHMLGGAERRTGRLWVHVRAPGERQDVRGWVPRSALGGYTAVRTRLVVDRARLIATLLRDERPVFRARVAIGMPSTPTPSGHFYVRNQLHRYRSPFYGPLAFGTSAKSSGVTDGPPVDSSASTAPTVRI